jgi:hypothetical protein
LHKDFKPTVSAEMTAALAAVILVIWAVQHNEAPTMFTLSTESGTACHASKCILQELYVKWFQIKLHYGHGHVDWWMPSEAGLADPLS